MSDAVKAVPPIVARVARRLLRAVNGSKIHGGVHATAAVDFDSMAARCRRSSPRIALTLASAQDIEVGNDKRPTRA